MEPTTTPTMDLTALTKIDSAFDLGHLLKFADTLICLAMETRQDDRIEQAHFRSWDTGWKLGFCMPAGEGSAARRFSYALQLEAMRAMPGALERIIELLCMYLNQDVPQEWRAEIDKVYAVLPAHAVQGDQLRAVLRTPAPRGRFKRLSPWQRRRAA